MNVFLSTADASGDLHAAALLEVLRKRDPALRAFGLGGSALAEAGFEALVSQSELATAGLVEVLGHAPRFLGAYARLRAALRSGHPSSGTDGKPDVCVLVDSPDLNLPLAAVAQRAGVPVVYYIAPQVWAWRGGRVRKLRRRADRVAVILPFEEPYLRERGIDATFVGHPLVERMQAVRCGLQPDEMARSLGLELDRPIVGLLPGSRSNEIAADLPLMLETAALTRRAHPDVQFRLLLAPTLAGRSFELPPGVEVVQGDTHRAMAISTCLLAAPGTVTVEAALLGVPTIVVHRVHDLTFELVRLVVRVPSSCMVNLIAGEGIVPERIQRFARPAALASLLCRLLSQPEERERMRRDLGRAVEQLGEPGVAGRVADLVLETARQT